MQGLHKRGGEKVGEILMALCLPPSKKPPMLNSKYEPYSGVHLKKRLLIPSTIDVKPEKKLTSLEALLVYDHAQSRTKFNHKLQI
jgi:hypothetical protein